MNKAYTLLLMLLLSLAGCSSYEQVSPIPPEQAAGSVSSVSSAALSGAEVASNLQGGLAGAQFDQKDFFDSTGGKVVPIIKIVLPTSATADAQFIYNAADQANNSGSRF